MNDLLPDLKYAARSLRRTPAFTAAVITTLALGIGANSALFSILDALLLRSLPVRAPNELFVFQRGDYSHPSFLRFRQRTDLFTDVFASSGPIRASLRVGNAPAEQADISLVSGSFFNTLGVPAVAGRTLTPTDDETGQAPVAVASYGFWQRYALDPDIIGRTITVNAARVTIVGVAPRFFFGERVGASPELWIPLTMWGQVVPGRDLVKSANTAWLQVIGRLAPGATIERASAALTIDYRRALNDSFGPRVPDDVRPFIEHATVQLEPAARGVSPLRREYGRPVQLLMGAVMLVLLVACANLANMLLIRALAAQRAVAIQLAMGITRWRLIRALLTETALFALAGCIVSIPVARWTTGVLLALISDGAMPVPLQATFEPRVWVFTGLVSLLTIVAIGLLPALRSTNIDLLTALRSPQRGGTARGGPGSALLVAQVTCAVVLLVSATLLVRTLANLRASDLGFSGDRLLVVDVDPRKAGYQGETYRALVGRLRERIQHVAGVTAATHTENGVLTGRDSSTDRLRPAVVLSAEGLPQERFDVVGPDYFRTMGIAMIAGRDFNVTDLATRGRVLILNQTLARHYFGDRNPIGQRMLWRGDTPWEVIGVVGTVMQSGPRDVQPFRFWVPYAQPSAAELASVRFVVRTSVESTAIATALRQSVADEDSALSVDTVDSISALLDRNLTRDRAVSTVASILGLLAAAIAGLGLYATLGYRVARRRAELGVRSALGARPLDLARLVMSDGARVVALGAALGVFGALGATRLLTGLLFGLSPTDVTTYVAAITMLSGVAFLASYGPARRAARADPLVSLRSE
jgi:putative ABC transport system permease protein